MKKILFLLLFICTVCKLSAQNVDFHSVKNKDANYLAGAVPEVNGVVQFEKKFKVANKNDQEIQAILLNYIQHALIPGAINDLRTRLIDDGSKNGTLSARIEEYIVFKKKPLYLDRTRIRYQLNASCQEGVVHLVATQISYYYNEQIDGTGGISYKAEEWITDQVAINKKGTKLYPKSGKFRRKTIDRMNKLFEDIMNEFNEKPQIVQEPKKNVLVIE